MLNIQRILVPIDFSDVSKAALEYATRLAEQFQASLQLLHVCNPPSYYGSLAGDIVVHVPEGRTTLEQFVRTRAGKELSRVLSDIQRATSVEVAGHLEMGDPCDSILKTAASGRYDLIVMGTHGRAGLSHMVLGSVAEKVVRGAACPVLTIRGAVASRPNVTERKSKHPEVAS